MLEFLFKMIKMGSAWKPDWLYESMPFVYVVAGLGTMFYFENLAGYVAGVLLISAALLIWKMRREYRAMKNKFV